MRVGTEHCTPYMESTVEQLPVSHKAWAWFEANKKQVLWGAAILLIAGLIVSFFLYRQNETEAAASQAISQVSMPQLMGTGGAASTAEAYLKVAATYPKTRAGERAVLLAAGSLFGEGKYPEAKAQFERFRREHPGSAFVGEAMLGIGACLESQGQSREAMAAYKELVDRRPGDSALSQARFALGRLHEAQNEPEQARKFFEDVERTDAYGSLGDEARMRLEELKQKHPKLFAPAAPPPATTNTLPLKVEKPK